MCSRNDLQIKTKWMQNISLVIEKSNTLTIRTTQRAIPNDLSLVNIIFSYPSIVENSSTTMKVSISV